jgi:NDP-sugar pyrophosphorylase family protein
MKAMVLAAGLGTRMRPLSDLLAKPVLPVLNEPLLHHTLRLLARHGFRDVVINTHHRPDTIRRALGSGRGRRFGVRVRYSHEPVILGSGGGPRLVREFFGTGPALLVNGDCVFDFDLTQLLRRHRATGAAATLALRPNPDVRRYGPVVTGRGGWIRSMRRLPHPARGTVSLFTGVQLLDPALLEELPEGPSDIVGDLYAKLLARGGRLLGVRVRGPWFDLGSPAFYLRSQLRLLSQSKGHTRGASLVARGARVAKDAQVVRSVVGRGSRIGARARVSGSVLWPGARIGANARVTESIVARGGRVAEGERVARGIVLPGGVVPLT